MTRCFVKDDDRVEIVVYVTETDDKNIEAGLSPQELSSGPLQEVKFTFRRPRHQDSLAVLASSRVGETGVSDIIGLQAAVLRLLLVDWDIKDEQNEPVPFTKAAIANLEPSIARAAATVF
jgi:hypothetical protein